MTPRSSAEVRQAFLEFFGGCDHAIVPSGPLVPVGDSTLLFTNAGMVQFKDLFLGRDQRPYTRAASCQCCVRAGGKHNDLENVGYTARHHTFFEMLGNFSFGDYFKREAIRYAWDFLTEVLVLDPGRLWITVFREDDEAASIWLDEIKVDRNRFSRCTEKDNFWTMGPTGPCGPCSEIFYDHGPGIAGGPPGSRDEQGDRYIEIWNLVFTQYDRDEGGALHSIPRPSVDTGMGLERIAAVMQGVHSNYEIDVFRALIDAILVQLVQRKGLPRASLQAIADHIRASAFIAAEGVLPSNEGRGYVLRRIIRRALRHGHKLGIEGSFFHRLVAVLTQQMGEAYPHLQQAKARVEKVLKQEEERFFETLDQGLKLLERSIATLSGRVIPGRDVFQLYDTYGFPLDLTADIARERGLTLDLEGFEREMERQRARGRAASQFYSTGGSPQGLLPKLDRDAVNRIGPSEFTGYTGLRGKARVLALYREGEAVELLEGGVPGVAVLDRTPFYAESGGQIGDAGELRGPAGVFEVHDTQRQAGVHMHLGPVQSGSLHLGDRVDTVVDGVRRQSTALNHSATHLLHAALRRSLGEHVVQKGSLVAHDRLRFDFSHPGALGRSELLEVETMVNDEIRANRAVETEVMAYQRAVKSGALAFFGEKYDDEVRVLRMGDFSMELCGGTHVRRTGDIGLFKIVAEGGVAAGVRRIEALTGETALHWVEEADLELQQLADLVKAPREQLLERIEQITHRLKQQERENQLLRARLSSEQGRDLEAKAVEIGGVKLIAEHLEGADVAGLRNSIDQLKDRLGSAVILLAGTEGDKVVLVAGVTGDLLARVKAGELVNFVASQVGGKGGGRPDFAQAGGNAPDQLPQALASVAEWLRGRLSG